MEQKIICRLCGEEQFTKAFSQHLKSKHSVSHSYYVEKYKLDFPTYHKCEWCDNITNKKHFCSRECYIEYKKTLTGEKSPHYGHHLSDASKLKMSKTQKERISKDGSWWTGKHHTEESKEKISKIRIEKGLAKGKNNGMYGKTHSPETVNKIMSHRPMNKFEKSVADELDRLGYKYTFQFFIKKGGIGKSYDFKLKGLPIIIEADGDFWHGNPDYKHHWKNSDSVKENDVLKESLAKERGYNVIRIWQSEFYKDKNILKEKLFTQKS